MCDIYFFFFKQKTAYEMRISDWSSDVCSSDLTSIERLRSAAMSTTYTIDTSTSRATPVSAPMKRMMVPAIRKRKGTDQPLVMLTAYTAPIGREECRERVCQYV